MPSPRPSYTTIFDCETGVQTTREMSEEEYAMADLNLEKSLEYQAIEEQKQADAVSGRQKLLDLGLSDAEVAALVGPPPPEGAEDPA
jgi:hypothetical protein